jgi:hypothetical protein
MAAREAPAVMLPSSTTAANRRKSVRSKCMAQSPSENHSAYVAAEGRVTEWHIALVGTGSQLWRMPNPIIHIDAIVATFADGVSQRGHWPRPAHGRNRPAQSGNASCPCRSPHRSAGVHYECLANDQRARPFDDDFG